MFDKIKVIVYNIREREEKEMNKTFFIYFIISGLAMTGLLFIIDRLLGVLEDKFL